MRIIGRSPSAGRGRPRPPRTAPCRRLSAKLLGIPRHGAERIEVFNRRVEALLHHLVKAVDARRAAAQHDSIDVIVGRTRLEKVEGLLDLEQYVLGDRVQDRLRLLVGGAIDRNPFFNCSAESNGRSSSFWTASV
jgi:hypothetical protein